VGEEAFVLLLTGPAGAGKTTVAAEWAATRTSATAHVSLDDVRDFVKAGYVNPEDGWNEETQAQYDLARELCATIARRYVDSGITCAVDDAIFPAWAEVGYERWDQALADAPHALVVLLPRLEVARRRNESGHDGHRRLRADTMRMIYDDMLPWRDTDAPVIDNSELSVAETVAEIDRVLAELELVAHG
jgi:adenylate kinase family enzyme